MDSLFLNNFYYNSIIVIEIVWKNNTKKSSFIEGLRQK